VSRLGFRALQQAEPFPNLIAASRVSNNNVGSLASGASTTLVTPAISVAAGDLLVFWGTTGANIIYNNNLTFATGGGAVVAAPTRLTYVATANYCSMTLWVARVSVGGTVTATATYTTSAAVTGSAIDLIIERWGNARVADTPNYGSSSVVSGTTQTSPLTPSSTQGVVTWTAADYTATNPAGTITYLNGSQTIAPYFVATFVGVYSGQATVNSLAATTFGLTTTVAQKDMVGTLELRPIGA
jgi:hypothetical protein